MIYTYDTEGDGFLEDTTKLHCTVFKQLNEENIIKQREEFNPDFLNDGDVLVCHNQFGHDLPVVRKLCGVEFNVRDNKLGDKRIEFVDTLAWSRRLHPDRPLPRGCPESAKNPVTGRMDKVAPHGLMAWGYRVGVKKPYISDWRNLSVDEYLHRCEEDVMINELVFLELCREGGVEL